MSQVNFVKNMFKKERRNWLVETRENSWKKIEKKEEKEVKQERNKALELKKAGRLKNKLMSSSDTSNSTFELPQFSSTMKFDKEVTESADDIYRFLNGNMWRKVSANARFSHIKMNFTQRK